jgi:carbamoyltransferase
MLILGWHGGILREWQDMEPGWSTHDGAAVLLKDGRVVAAVEEERLNRVKHSNFSRRWRFAVASNWEISSYRT